MDKDAYKELKKKLLSTKKNGYDLVSAGDLKAMEDYCRGYMAFLDAGKTERLCAAEAIRLRREAEKKRKQLEYELLYGI